MQANILSLNYRQSPSWKEALTVYSCRFQHFSLNSQQRKNTNQQEYRRLEHYHQPTGPNWSHPKDIKIHILFKFTWDISQRRPYVNHETILKMFESFTIIEYVLWPQLIKLEINSCYLENLYIFRNRTAHFQITQR